MLSVSDALALIVQTVERLHAVPVSLEKGLGLVLAEDVSSDIDSPPFDKALMDGYAVRAADLRSGRAELDVVEEVTAGRSPQRTVEPGKATRIMTGAPMPRGADAVVPIEHSRKPEHSRGHADEVVVLDTTPTEPGRNVLYQGASLRAGEIVITGGTLLRAQQLGCLAELSRSRVAVFPRPRAAVLATGDELVPIETTPAAGEIRNSNETMLAAQLQQAGAEPIPLGIARDDPADLREKIGRGLQADLLLLSGGVSAGKLDLVPGVLRELHVREIFHKVRIKPGQPLWFGVANDRPHPQPLSRGERGETLWPPCYVFGLPGNPVSSMVCCELFVRTALRRLMGIEPAEPQPVRAVLTSEHLNKGDRPTYHPARLTSTPTGFETAPVPWIGSADLCATTRANAMALFPEGNTCYRAGDTLDVFPW